MKSSHTRSQRLHEYAAVCLFGLLAGWSVWRLAVAAEWRIFPVLLVAGPIAWLATDLLSGLLHWAFDTWGSANTPVIGQAFIRPFREHHIDPQAMARHGFVETHGASCLAALPFLAATSRMPLESGVSLLTQACLLSVALGALATNQCHKWAHMDEAATPIVVRWLQRYRLILARGHHRRHHSPPFNTHFCMASGWLNALFDSVLRAWR